MLAQDVPRFTPPRLLQSANAQTLAGILWPRWLRRPRLMLRPPERLYIEVEGGRLLARGHFLDDDRERLTVLLLHGMEGNVDQPYMSGMAQKCLRAGWNAVLLNLRSCGGTERLSPTLYHAGMSSDVAAVVEHLAVARGLRRVAVLGFSLGGNLALKLAGEHQGGASSALRSVVAISPLVDLEACTQALDRPRSRLYRWLFLNLFRQRVLRHGAHYKARYDLDVLRSVHTIADFHHRFVAPHFGFRGASDYCRQASSASLLSAIRVPTLVLHAEDDPIVPLPDAARRALQDNAAVRLCVTPRGGHLGFVAAEGEGEDRLWAENRAVEFLRSAA